MESHLLRGSDRLAVVAHGTFVLPQDGHSLTITPVQELKFTFQFGRGPGELSARATQDGPDHILLKLMNFDTPIGASFDAKVGSLDGDPLFLALAVYAITSDSTAKHPPRVFHFTLYRGVSK